MFKKIIIIIIFILLSQVWVFSQSESDKGKYNYKILFGYQHSSVIFNSANQFALGLEYFITGNLSLNYYLSFNFLDDKTFFHAPAGLVGAYYMIIPNFSLDNFSTEELIAIGLILLFIPEGVSYYLPVNEKIKLVPYINPLGYDYVINDYSLTSTVGMKLEINPFINVSLNPFADIKFFYKHHTAHFGLEAGLFMAVRF